MKKYIKKYKRGPRSYKKAPMYSTPVTKSFVSWHVRTFNIETDVLGTDGQSVDLDIRAFRNVADCAGMFKSFKVLAYGLEVIPRLLDPATKTNTSINIGMTARKIP